MIGPFGKELKIGSQTNRWRTKVGFYSAEKERRKELQRLRKLAWKRQSTKQASSLDPTLFFLCFFSVFFVKSHNSKVNLMKIKEGTHKDHKASCLLLWKKIFPKRISKRNDFTDFTQL